jgi:phage terminase large subunit-like protein
MSKSKLSEDQWAALFADERAGLSRRELSAKYGVHPGTINRQASLRGLLKRQTGAPDQRCIPPGGWPPDRIIPQSKSGMTGREWDAALDRYLAGEDSAVIEADIGVGPGALTSRAHAVGRQKKQTPGAVYRSTGPRPVTVEGVTETRLLVRCKARAFLLDLDRPEATIAELTARIREAGDNGDRQAVADYLRMRNRVQRTLDEGRLPESAPDPHDDAPAAAPIELRESQRPPDGAWSTWLFLGGRGAGKTLAGASWLADQAEALGAGGRLALIGPTLHDVREVMIEGVSGIRSLPRWTRATRPKFQSSRRRLIFRNGCQAYAFSAEDPDSLRGPQFSAAWADEFCAWRGSGPRGAAETLALLRMGLRLPLRPSTASRSPSPSQGDGEETDAPTVSSPLRGEGDPEGVEGRNPRPAPPTHPRLVVTTTPRPTRALVRLRDEAGCALTHAPTAENAEHLSPGFLDNLHALYGGTRRAAQELDGRIVELDGALFTVEMMARARLQPSPSPSRGGQAAQRPGGDGSTNAPPPPAASGRPHPVASGDPPPRSGEGERQSLPPFDRTIVAIDPAATARGDACGLIAAASYRRADGTRCAVILADRSIAGLGPDAWARRAVALAREFGATAVVAEVNQGGDMVRAVLKTAGATLKIREVHATRGKYIRAEPVAALYEQGRIHHAGPFDALEEELMAFGGQMEAAGSLDRADALVWAVTDLLVDAPDGDRGPRVRWL